jgi:fructose-1,6-bisphosphatase/inositol monophosphatase family enzyme
MFTAVRDGGSTLNGRLIAVSANHQLHSSLLATQVQSDDERLFGGTARPTNARRTSWRRMGICMMIYAGSVH